MSNPLLNLQPLPRFHEIQPEHVVPGMKELLASLEESFTAYEKAVEPTWDGLTRQLYDLCEPLAEAWGVVNHLMGVRNSDALREAHQEIQPLVVRLFMRISQSKPYYDALLQLRSGDEWAGLDASQQRVIEKKIVDSELSGIGLEGDAKTRFNEVEERLSELQTEFSNHVLDATKAFSLLIENVDDVAGVPDSWKELASGSAKAHGFDSASVEKGPWRVSLDPPNYIPFMRFCQNRELRETLYRAQVTKASDGDLDNTALIDAILELRGEQTKLLGYDHFAALSLKTKMATDVAEVSSLLDELADKSHQTAQTELDELRALWAEGGVGTQPDHELKPWDIEFLSQKLKQRRFQFSDEETRPYFPLPKVLNGLFSLVEHLFGIQVTQGDENVSLWNEDVQYFLVKDAAGTPIASFFLDAYSRPQNKRGGAWMDECKSRYLRSDEKGLQLPVAYLVCNQTPPVGEKPSLMTFNEVETLFHEFGHGLHHMLTRVDYPEASGINGVEWDAVELPSQFMENWCYHRDTLLGMSSHVDSGEQLPEDLFNKIRGARTYRAASMMLRQIYFARLDLALHSDFQTGREKSVFDIQQEVADATLVFPPLKEDRFLCSFGHIFAGGYAAGYYSYKWAEVLSADAFGAFEDVGIDNDDAVSEVGKKFRDTVLALGGSHHPMDIFVSFRGRKPSTEALLRHSDLSGPSPAS